MIFTLYKIYNYILIYFHNNLRRKIGLQVFVYDNLCSSYNNNFYTVDIARDKYIEIGQSCENKKTKN